jgi:putative GTP pyrophosphokinase
MDEISDAAAADSADAAQEFDFEAHRQSALAAYLPQQDFYEDLASAVRRILEEAIKRKGIKVHSVFARAKEPASLGRKAAQQSDVDPSKPKYPRPLEQITDLAGVRIITYFPDTLVQIDEVMAEEFQVVERSDKGAELVDEDRLGYQSIHYLVKLSESRSTLPEYEPFADSITEIQVRTILQHAWAEIEHDIRYKSTSLIPSEVRHRFTALAGLLEIADREFQAIQDADRRVTEQARSQVEAGQLSGVEVTADALKAFLDRKLGADGRMSEFSYQWMASTLKRLGFKTLQQVDDCIRGYDDDQLSRVIYGGRLGQLSRFEIVLLAGMGEKLPQTIGGWYGEASRRHLNSLMSAGVRVGDYDPLLSDGAGS